VLRKPAPGSAALPVCGHCKQTGARDATFALSKASTIAPPSLLDRISFHRSTTSAGIPRWRSIPTHTLPSCSRHHPRGSGRKNGFTGAINMPSTRIG